MFSSEPTQRLRQGLVEIGDKAGDPFYDLSVRITLVRNTDSFKLS
jgi:hypothetical protein